MSDHTVQTMRLALDLCDSGAITVRHSILSALCAAEIERIAPDHNTEMYMLIHMGMLMSVHAPTMAGATLEEMAVTCPEVLAKLREILDDLHTVAEERGL